jgi:hypothetical protein
MYHVHAEHRRNRLIDEGALKPLDDAGLVPLGDVVLEALALSAGDIDALFDRLAVELDVDTLDARLADLVDSLGVGRPAAAGVVGSNARQIALDRQADGL